MRPEDSSNWTWLGSVAPKDLLEARLQTHYASQFVAAFGAAYVQRTEDMSHVGMTWGGKRHAFISGTASGARMMRMALDLSRFELYALEPGSEFIGVLDRFNLKDTTFGDAARWLRKTSAKFGFDPELIKMDFEDLLDHPLAGGGAFTYDGDEEDMAELGRYFANSNFLLKKICSQISSFSRAYVWSSHLDINVIYATEESTNRGFTLGMGMSPGDRVMGEPFFYVNRLPIIENIALPDPPANAQWRQKDWTGLTLAASQIIQRKTAREQMEFTEDFLRSSTGILNNL